MAEAEYEYYTIKDIIRQNIYDNTGADFSKIPENIYDAFICQNLLTEQTFQFSKIMDNLYKYNFVTGGYYNHIYHMRCVGEDDLTYKLLANGVIKVTDESATPSDIDSRSVIPVTGCLCDFGKVMDQVFRHLAYNFSNDISKAIGDSSINPADIRRELIILAGIAVGTRSIDYD